MGHRLDMTSRGFLQPRGDPRGTGNSFHPPIGQINKGRFRETGRGVGEIGEYPSWDWNSALSGVVMSVRHCITVESCLLGGQGKKVSRNLRGAPHPVLSGGRQLRWGGMGRWKNRGQMAELRAG